MGRLCCADTAIPAAGYSHQVQCTGINCSSGTLNLQDFFTMLLFSLYKLSFPHHFAYRINSSVFSKLLFFSDTLWAKILGFQSYFLKEELNYHKGLQKPFDTLMI